MTSKSLNAAAAAMCVALTAAMSSGASAADLGGYGPYNPPPEYVPSAPAAYAPIWEGLYVGVNGGYGWGDSSFTDPSGGFGGAQIGYNLQRGSLVFGIEGDYQLADFDDASAFLIPGGTGAASSSTDWFSTIRGRLGVASGPVLFYATGGVAFADIDTTIGLQQGATNVLFHDSSTQTGYVVGGGVEWALGSNWSAKAEYLYLDFGDSDISGIDNFGAAYTAKVDNDMQTVRLGLNYKF